MRFNRRRRVSFYDIPVQNPTRISIPYILLRCRKIEHIGSFTVGAAIEIYDLSSRSDKDGLAVVNGQNGLTIRFSEARP